MDLVEGVPSIRIEGDRERALTLIPEGRLLLAKAQAVARRAKIPTYSMQRRVDDDSYIYVLVAGGQNIVQISVAPRVPSEAYSDWVMPVPAMAPTILSGLIIDGWLTPQIRDGKEVLALKSFIPTVAAANRNKLLAAYRQPSLRLAVRPHASVPEWTPTTAGERQPTQYLSARSSMWSGSMKKVVQVLLGLGRVPKAYFTSKNPYLKTPYMDSAVANGVQVTYDYKFMRTHGITVGEDGRRWLVEISAARGVIAMPLPMFDGTTTETFKMQCLNRFDMDMYTVVDELRGLPTGENFPTGKEFTKKVDAGDILQLMSAKDLGEFYKLSGYSTSCGWAFNDSGTEAHNVGYYYPEDDVFQKGCWYQLNIRIGLYRAPNQRRKGEPCATSATASLRLQSEGYLYSPPVKKSFIPVKYYEPMIGGLLSHSAKPLGPSPHTVNCDTVVFVAFMDGDLKTAKYFKPGQAELHVTTTDDRSPGECLLEGTWTWTSTSGSRSLPTMPYTNDIDLRSVMEEHFTTTTLTSNSLGFNPPEYSDFIDSPETCFVWRTKTYRQETRTEERGGEYRGACFVVPAYSREAYYFFEGHAYNGGRRGSTSVQYADIMDPNTYYGWRRFPRINYPPWPSGYGCDQGKCGGKHVERRIVCLVRDGDGYQGPWAIGGAGGCRSFADSGPWAEECQDVVSLCSGKQPIRTPYYKGWDKGNDFEGNWHLVSAGLHGKVKGPLTSNQFEYAMSPSPDPETDLTQFICAQHSAIGDDCVMYMQGFFGERAIKGIIPTNTLTASEGYPVFIGVNGA